MQLNIVKPTAVQLQTQDNLGVEEKSKMDLFILFCGRGIVLFWKTDKRTLLTCLPTC